ncbi:hypothetical protein [Paenibacillus sp. 453mf]|uniref:hypothetical protein n=1 Tax=Paenibacillus sp. 453mf TaxID=1761874 RepID=UPI0008F2925F|nr:hypothetical protein [Paenibacillus sp. 453mf]SFS83153.1 hypothetical protein SAMN04488601_104183 [Paenibacillus sp. 453mf]
MTQNDATRQYLLNSQSRGVKDEVVKAEHIEETTSYNEEFAWAHEVSRSAENQRVKGAAQISTEIANVAPVYRTIADTEFGTEDEGTIPRGEADAEPVEWKGKSETHAMFRRSYE